MKKTVVVLSGAGMSVESGISTFRDSGGLWEKYKIEDVATPDAWRRNPNLVSLFYNERRKQIIETEPNPAHFLLALQETNHKIKIITQNIDDLHERAGSSSILHLHGNIRFSKSSGPAQESEYFPIVGSELTEQDVCPLGYRLRPHVVWFGEDVPLLNEAAQLIRAADAFIIVGTSLNVYPAAGLIHAVSKSCQCFIVDPNANQITTPANFKVLALSASEGLSVVFEEITQM